MILLKSVAVRGMSAPTTPLSMALRGWLGPPSTDKGLYGFAQGLPNKRLKPTSRRQDNDDDILLFILR